MKIGFDLIKLIPQYYPHVPGGFYAIYKFLLPSFSLTLFIPSISFPNRKSSIIFLPYPVHMQLHSLYGCLFLHIFPPFSYLPSGFSQHTAIRMFFMHIDSCAERSSHEVDRYGHVGNLTVHHATQKD
ncbi:hypothetical protein METP2_01220 [Methanosarcinales archaeon]|nr:hypothetical protein METP2_01220 [Methanosarcinales archaeon]